MSPKRDTNNLIQAIIWQALIFVQVKYELKSLTLNDGTRDVAISSVAQAAYFPTSVTHLTYTIVADAKAGSLVQDITSATGSITIDAGKHTTLNLQLNPIDPSLVVIETDTDYNGEFQ